MKVEAGQIFSPFFDEVDGVLCVSAKARVAEIGAAIGAQPLRFPLILDETATLRQQIEASTHAPASCRFGPYNDNILGMNWRLPGGRIVRIGERVVKTTTGYDWLRFLLHSGARFGEPVDYVLRLRPQCGFSAMARFDGPIEVVRLCISRLLHSGWMHWWDAVDFVTGENGSFARVQVHCAPEEFSIYTEQLHKVAAASQTKLTLENDSAPSADGLPDVVVKITPDRAISLARELAEGARHCVVLTYHGVVHVYMNPDRDLAPQIEALVRPHLTELYDLGGDWHSRWLPAITPNSAESRWLTILEKAINEP
jgi:FAD/FMN-containing dehydrogenase